MASIQKRKNKNGTSHWAPLWASKGYPTFCNHFERKQEAEDWASELERQIRQGQFNFNHHTQKRTLAELIQRFKSSGAL